MEESICSGLTVNQAQGSRHNQEGLGSSDTGLKGFPRVGRHGLSLASMRPGLISSVYLVARVLTSNSTTKTALLAVAGGYLRSWLWRAVQTFQEGVPGMVCHFTPNLTDRQRSYSQWPLIAQVMVCTTSVSFPTTRLTPSRWQPALLPF